MDNRILIFNNNDHLRHWFREIYDFLYKSNPEIIFKCKVNESIDYGTIRLIFVTLLPNQVLTGYSEQIPRYYEVEHNLEEDFVLTVKKIFEGGKLEIEDNKIDKLIFNDMHIRNAFAEGLAAGLQRTPNEHIVETIRSSLYINGKEIENGIQMLEELKSMTRENNELKNDLKAILDNVEETYHCHFDDMRKKWNLERKD